MSQHRNAQSSPLLPRCSNLEAFKYASLNCTHFVTAHKLFAEGDWRYKNRPDGKTLKLLAGDPEGELIQKTGVNCLVYDEGLWYDEPALQALMREDNCNSAMALPETEVDALGALNNALAELTKKKPGGNRL